MAWNGSQISSDPGGKRPDGDASRRPHSSHRASLSPFNLKALFAGAIIIVFGAGAIWYFVGNRQQDNPSIEKPSGRHLEQSTNAAPAITEAMPRHRRKTDQGRRAEAKKAEYTAEPIGGKKDLIDPDFLKKWVKTPGCLPMANGFVHRFPPPKPGCTATVLVNGHTWVCDSEGNFEDTTPAPIFGDRFHDVFMALAINDGSYLLSSCLDFTEQEILNALITPIQINEDDTPEQIEAKEAVASLKEELKEYLKSGGKYEDFVMDMNEHRTNEKDLKATAMTELVKLLHEGDVEGARLYRDKVESFLNGNGYYGLRLPENWEEILATDE